MVVPFGIILSAVVVIIATGRLGGELVLRHRIGMIDDKSEALPSAAGTPITGIDVSHAGGRRTPNDRSHSRPPFEAHEVRLFDRRSFLTARRAGGQVAAL